MVYGTYEFYQESFGGDAIHQDDFDRLAKRASEYINMATFGRAKEYIDDEDLLKRACCALAEAIKLNEEGGGVVAESIGKITKNYAAGVTNTPNEEERLSIAICRYLLPTGLLYLGV
ncbi:hypothetical protein [Anaerotignum sp.]|uniref:hypothetical protein n=1 Tax=Anaerotignum sp. TaxID=2039241 RepID=UPI00289A6B9B|nr:hypothetical protein [Anaerotignum sp.]